MCAFLFNRRSPVVYPLTLLSLYFLYHGIAVLKGSESPWQCALLALSMGLFGFLLLCRFIPWYSRPHRGYGIEEHFGNIFLLSAYTFVVLGGLFLLSQWTIFLGIAIPPLAFFAAVHGILIVYHFKDASQVPPSYHSRSLYEHT